MSKAEVTEENYILVDGDKLKDEHKAELQKATYAYKQACLKSFSASRSGDVIKKFDFPTLQTFTEAQREDRMARMVHQAVGQAFISHGPVMTNSVHNDVVKTLQEEGLQGFMGPAYQQASQMIFAPIESATAVPPVNPQTQIEGSVGVTQPISTTALPQLAPVFTIYTAMATHAQGDFMTGFHAGWDPASGLGMPPEFFIPSAGGQASSSASQPSNQQITASAPQLTKPQDSTLAP